MSTIFTVVLIISRLAYVNGGPTCDSMEPICTRDGVSFSVVHHNGSVAEDGPNYYCLGSGPADRPDPAWFYLKISTAGDIYMELTALRDIDFIIYGPYDDVPYAQAKCARMGQNVTEIVDCSFSGTNHEFPQIIGAVVGQVYVMLITNYAEIDQNISLVSRNISTGATDCGILTTGSPTVGTVPTTSPTLIPTVQDSSDSDSDSDSDSYSDSAGSAFEWDDITNDEGTIQQKQESDNQYMAVSLRTEAWINVCVWWGIFVVIACMTGLSYYFCTKSKRTATLI